MNLLVNKFRGKYISSVVSDESNVDRIIRTEVTRFLEHEQMTEGNLVKLDQRLGELLENGGSKPQSGQYGRTPLESRGGQDTLYTSVDYNSSRGPSGLTKGHRHPCLRMAPRGAAHLLSNRSATRSCLVHPTAASPPPARTVTTGPRSSCTTWSSSRRTRTRSS